MINVLKAYCEEIDYTAVVITGTLSSSRKAMGWDDKGKLFSTHVVLEDDEWQSKGVELLEQYKDRLHVFNGITHPARMSFIIRHAIGSGIKFCNMSEAYSNLQSGWRGLLKQLYLSLYLPCKVRPIARHSLGVLCLSGGAACNLRQFERLGFDRQRVFPYGYYTDEDEAYRYVKAADGKVHILCPGLLEKYKGVDILIKALDIVNKRGCGDYVCHITGKGSQELYLTSLVGKYGLENNVIFEGVLDAGSYADLLSHVDMLVAPGRVEPWGIRINEAIQRGNVVIVSDGLGAAELVRASGGGAVFKSGDCRDLADKIISFLNDADCLEQAKKRNQDYRPIISCSNQAKALSGIIESIQK